MRWAIAAGLVFLASSATAQINPGEIVRALQTTPGCLGVETAETRSGKRVIFAWFENKKALVDWYYSDVHQRAMKRAFPDVSFERRPLPDLAEDSGPILTIVSMAASSIGIELYGPLPGGVAVGGRFAPEALKVPGLRQIP